MKVESVMITGANRGIGLEFVRQFSKMMDPPDYIFASYRSANSLKDLKEIKESSEKSKIIMIKMDVTCPKEIEGAKTLVEETLGNKGLNLLINNAGVGVPDTFPNTTAESMIDTFKVNAVGPVMVLQAMMPSLEKAAQVPSNVNGLSVFRAAVINLTSRIGSIANTTQPYDKGLYAPAYKMSKAALNMAMRIVSTHKKDQGILVVMICPNWVKTELSRGLGDLEIDESISKMIKTMYMLNESHNGCYMDENGKPFQF